MFIVLTGVSGVNGQAVKFNLTQISVLETIKVTRGAREYVMIRSQLYEGMYQSAQVKSSRPEFAKVVL